MLLLLLAVALALSRPVTRTAALVDLCTGVSCGASISVVHQPLEPRLVAERSASLANASPSLLAFDDSALAMALPAPDLVVEGEPGQIAGEAVQPAEALIEVVRVERLEALVETSAREPLVGGLSAAGDVKAAQDQALADGLLLARLIGELKSESEPDPPTVPNSAPDRATVLAPAGEPEPTATLEPSPTPQPSPTERPASRVPRRTATPTATPRAERMARARSASPTAVPAPTVQVAESAAATAPTPTQEAVEPGPTVPPVTPTAEPSVAPPKPAGLLWPARGPLTTRFGEVGWYAPRGHSGLDIAARHGAPVIAAAAGRVVLATHDGNGYGIHVVIEHGGGLRTLYAHLSQLVVAGGQAVERGEVIGRVGSTGLSTGPHLHFEVRQQGVLRDPLAYLR